MGSFGTIYSFLNGGVALGCWVVGLFFLRFWKLTHDRLFQIFAYAFWLLCIERTLPPLLEMSNDSTRAIVYSIRLVAFLLIAIAIINKNRKAHGGRPRDWI